MGYFSEEKGPAANKEEKGPAKARYARYTEEEEIKAEDGCVLPASLLNSQTNSAMIQLEKARQSEP